MLDKLPTNYLALKIKLSKKLDEIGNDATNNKEISPQNDNRKYKTLN